MSLCQHTSGEVSSSARVDKDTQGEEIQENILCLSRLNWWLASTKINNILSTSIKTCMMESKWMNFHTEKTFQNPNIVFYNYCLYSADTLVYNLLSISECRNNRMRAGAAEKRILLGNYRSCTVSVIPIVNLCKEWRHPSQPFNLILNLSLRT